MLEEMQKACKAAQVTAASLRRAITDMRKMRKSLDKTRKQAQAKNAARGEGRAAPEDKVKNILQGRTNLTKCVGSNDPPILQKFKEAMAKKPMTAVKDPKELSDCPTQSVNCFVVRKGRNIMRFLCKTDEVRDIMTRTVAQFKEKLLTSSSEKAVSLVCNELGSYCLHA